MSVRKSADLGSWGNRNTNFKIVDEPEDVKAERTFLPQSVLIGLIGLGQSKTKKVVTLTYGALACMHVCCAWKAAV